MDKSNEQIKEYFIGAWQSNDGKRTFKLTRNGRGVRDTINLYLDGEKVGVYPRAKNAKKVGLVHIRGKS